MELCDIIGFLSEIERDVERFDAHSTGCTNTSVTRGDGYWKLTINHKVQLDKTTFDRSEYTRTFEDIQDLRDHLNAISVGYSIAAWQEV